MHPLIIAAALTLALLLMGFFAWRRLRGELPGLMLSCTWGVAALFAGIAAYRALAPTGCPPGAQWQQRATSSMVERVCVNGAGLRHGPAIQRKHGGRLVAKGAYREDEPSGLWRRYFRDGRVSERAVYREGHRHGLWQRWDVDGILRGQGTMHRGRGRWRAFHTNGKVSEVGLIDRGKREGTWRYLSKDGRVIAIGAFAGGEKTGLWKSFHDGGKRAWEGGFKRGRRDGEWRFWDDTGQLQREGRYRQGRRVGRWRWHCAQCSDCEPCKVKGVVTTKIVEKTYGLLKKTRDESSAAGSVGGDVARAPVARAKPGASRGKTPAKSSSSARCSGLGGPVLNPKKVPGKQSASLPCAAPH